MASSAAPMNSIWKKWSITQTLEKPPSSARRAVSARRWRSEAGPSGVVKLGIWSPSRMAISWSAQSAESKGARPSSTASKASLP